MKVPPKKQGNGVAEPHVAVSGDASMKALPEGKGNIHLDYPLLLPAGHLNESLR